MTLQRALHYVLANDPAVSGKVSSRIYNHKPPRGTEPAKYPLLLISLVDSEHIHTNDGNTGFARWTFEITVEAKTAQELNETAKAVRVLLHGTRSALFGDSGSGLSVDVQGITLQGQTDSMDGPDDGSDRGVHVRDMDFEIWWREAKS